MRSINKVILIGNLTRNPETKEVQNGQKITTFSIATNRRWMTSGGDDKTSTEYHDCVAWAKLAEICEKYLTKGKLVYVEGYLKTRSWTTEEGVKRFRTEVVVQDLIMLDKKGETEAEYLSEDMGEMAEMDTSELNTSEDLVDSTNLEDAPSEAAAVEALSSETETAEVAEEKQEENVF